MFVLQTVSTHSWQLQPSSSLRSFFNMPHTSFSQRPSITSGILSWPLTAISTLDLRYILPKEPKKYVGDFFKITRQLRTEFLGPLNSAYGQKNHLKWSPLKFVNSISPYIFCPFFVVLCSIYAFASAYGFPSHF